MDDGTARRVEDTDDAERVDQRAIRRASLSAVLRRVAAEGPRSRATLAVETGLNKSTTSSLVRELVDRGLLVETDELENPGRVGRPAQKVRFAGSALAAVGLEINVDYLEVCVIDLERRLRYERRVELDNAALTPARSLARLVKLAQGAIDAVEADGARVVGVALAVPGLVDTATGTLAIAPNLDWRDVGCAAYLREHLGRPELTLAVDNEANFAAIAEHWEGAARDLADFVCVSGAIGVGAGLFVDGRLFRGRHGYGGEFGHVVVDHDGPLCACGAHGCVQAVAGQAALLDAAGIAEHDEAAGGGLAALLARARAGDARTLDALSVAGHALGVALSSTVNLLDSEAVLLGGYLAAFAEWLVEPVRAELEERVLGPELRGCEVRAAALGGDAAVRGAAASILSMVMGDPALVGERSPASA